MQINHQVYVIFILFLVLFIFGALIFYQQLKINEILAFLQATRGQTFIQEQNIPINNGESVKSEDPLENIKSDIVKNTNALDGTIIEIGAEEVKVEGKIIDLQNLKEGDLGEEQIAPPTTKKLFTVKVDKNTQFPVIPREKLRIGDNVKIETMDTIYEKDVILASVFIAYNIKPEGFQERVKD